MSKKFFLSYGIPRQVTPVAKQPKFKSSNGFSYPVFNAMSSSIVGGAMGAVTESLDKYDSKLIMADVPGNVIELIDQWVDKNVERCCLTEDGVPDEYHISMVYNVNDTNDNIEKITSKFIVPRITLGQTAVFNTDDSDILVIEVSSILLEDLCDSLENFIDNDPLFDERNLHITVAYFQKGKLPESLIGSDYFNNYSFVPNGIFLSEKSGELVKLKTK